MMYNTLRGILKIMMFKKLVQKLNIEKEKTSGAAINPIDVDFDTRKNDFLNKLTQNAVKMYERNVMLKILLNSFSRIRKIHPIMIWSISSLTTE